MRNVRFALNSFAAFALLLGCTFLAQAQANRTWVKSTGSDANTATNCGLAAPCRTFAAAISVTNNQGEVDAIDAADYSSSPLAPIVITKSITIDGGGVGYVTAGNATVPPSNAFNITPTVVQDVVTLRRLSITGVHPGGFPSGGLGNGIFFNGKGALVVERCQIGNFAGAGILFQPPNGGDLYARDSEVTNNEFFGIRIDSSGPGAARGFLDNLRINNNGIFGTGVGLYASSRSQVNMTDCVINGNGLHGISADPQGSTAEVNVESTSVSGNNVGIRAGFSAGLGTVRISNVDVFDNAGAGIAWTGGTGTITSFGNNRIAGNGAGNGPPTATLPQQ